MWLSVRQKYSVRTGVMNSEWSCAMYWRTEPSLRMFHERVLLTISLLRVNPRVQCSCKIKGTNQTQLHLKKNVTLCGWIICRKSQLSLVNKLPVYKAILKPTWTYGVQLWESASNSNLEILESFQSKVLLIITDAPRYVPNAVIMRDLQVLSVRQ